MPFSNFSEDYDMLSDTEIDLLISDFPVDLMKENLRYQIQNPLNTTVNYMETMLDRYRVVREQISENVDALNQLNSSMISFFQFLVNEINEKFDMGFNVDLLDNIEDCTEYGMALYNFMILRYRRNVTKYLQRFINKNKKELVQQFDSLRRNKDVTTISTKKKVKNKDDVLIISNLSKIIPHVIQLETEPAYFIRYADSEESYDAAILLRLVNEGNMIGNFTRPYLDLIVDEYDYVLDEIQTEIKTQMQNK